MIIIIPLVCVLITAAVSNSQLPDGVFVFKEIWFLISTGALLLACFFKSFGYKKKDRFLINYIDLFVITYFLYSIINSYFKTDYIPVFLHRSIIALALITTYIIVKKIIAKMLLSTKMIVGLFCSLAFFQMAIGMIQQFGFVKSHHHAFSITGSFFNPAPYAIYLASLVAFLIPVLVYFIKYKINYLCIYVIIFIIFNSFLLIILCFSRSAWVGLLAALLISFIFLFPAKFKVIWQTFKYKRLLTTLSFFFFVLGVFWLFYLKQDSTIGRLLTWNISLEIIKDHFLTGIGSGNFPIKYLDYQYSYFINSNTTYSVYHNVAGDVRFAFNDALQLICEEGIIGLMLIGLIAFFTLFSFKRKINSTQLNVNYTLLIACVSSLTVLLISGLFSYPLIILPIKIHFLVLLAILSSIIRKTEFMSLHKRVYYKRKAGSLISIILGIFFIYYGIRRWYGFNELQRICTLEKVVSNDILKLHRILADHPIYLIFLSKSYIQEKLYNNALNVLKQAKKVSPEKEIYYESGNVYLDINNYKLAEKNYLIISTAIPNLLIPKYLLAKLYYQSQQKAKWQHMSRHVITFKPKVITIETILMQREIKILSNSIVK
jgi:O-antigen ligase